MHGMAVIITYLKIDIALYNLILREQNYYIYIEKNMNRKQMQPYKIETQEILETIGL